jgi:hypothetical protein
MRVLFASLASPGHTYPLIPLAVAAREAGHEVHYAAGEHVHPPLVANGLRPFRPADSFYELYAEDLEPELARLRPGLVIHEWGVPGAAVAARRAGIPSLWHGFGRMFPEGIGLERPTADGRPHIDICPPSLQDPGFVADADRIELRHVPFSEPAALPDRAGQPGSRPLIYLTLGTAFDELGDTPADVTVLPWVPQADLWPHVDVVVHHGGSGTTLGALTVGVPQLLLPQGADQFANAGAVTAAGAGLRLLPDAVSADAIAECARTLLPPGTAHRDAARGIAEEIARMPAPDEVARRLPEYAAGPPG